MTGSRGLLPLRRRIARLRRVGADAIDDVRLRAERSKQDGLASVSFCTTMRDRLDHARATVPQNLRDNADHPAFEIVLLDYSCPDPRTPDWVRSELSEAMESGRLRYFRLEGADAFNGTHAKNLAARLASNEVICNVDADNRPGPGFARYLSEVVGPGGRFACGPRDGRGLGGRIGVLRSDWERVGGYDERFVTYAPDDLDFTNRLQMIGLRKRVIRQERYHGIITHERSRSAPTHNLDHYFEIVEQNRRDRVISPNGTDFGRARVQENFDRWIEV